MSEERPHYLGHRERLRTRFLDAGVSGFADHEILELLLTFALARKDVKPLAKGLLDRFGTLNRIFGAPVEELSSVNGVGAASAVLIRLAGECGRICLREEGIARLRIGSPQALYDYCRTALGSLRDEEFRCFFLDTQNQVIAEEVLQTGTVDQAAVYPRKVFERALQHKASGLLFVHNHPSGSLEPSAQDVELTRTLAQTAAAMGVRVLDHVIVADDGYTSLNERGIL